MLDLLIHILTQEGHHSSTSCLKRKFIDCPLEDRLDLWKPSCGWIVTLVRVTPQRCSYLFLELTSDWLNHVVLELLSQSKTFSSFMSQTVRDRMAAGFLQRSSKNTLARVNNKSRTIRPTEPVPILRSAHHQPSDRPKGRCSVAQFQGRTTPRVPQIKQLTTEWQDEAEPVWCISFSPCLVCLPAFDFMSDKIQRFIISIHEVQTVCGRDDVTVNELDTHRKTGNTWSMMTLGCRRRIFRFNPNIQMLSGLCSHDHRRSPVIFTNKLFCATDWWIAGSILIIYWR